MEKVKVTAEQAKEIEVIKINGQEQVDYSINIHPYNKRPDLRIADLSAGELARALLIGYEIEREFKAGDWVVDLSGKVGRIDRVKEIKSVLGNSQRVVVDSIINYPDSLRYATPEEIKEEKRRRWWAKNNRDVWELKVGDVLMTKEFGKPKIVVVTKVTKMEITTVGTETYTRTIYILETNFKVVCFKENRLDIGESL